MKKKKMMKINSVHEYQRYRQHQLQCELAPQNGLQIFPLYLRNGLNYVTFIGITDFPYENVPLWQEYLKPYHGELLVCTDPQIQADISTRLNSTKEELKDRLEKAKDSVQQAAISKELKALEPLIDMYTDKEIFVRYTAIIKFSHSNLEELERRVTEYLNYIKKNRL